ncbi:hypothetical protein [Streptacidiphilus jiangxiensis]|uniref:Uncharacterized protein n=1 Tax=Streptacidiphilus jiangxiensis TaxID=235985 RepID=A0A1H8B9B8_STRJI|nr:hypothetical protein [Streptacidiphilus jiangxiensis]SEM79535.1 hypothetical protein SAMN05414137_1601 [Streptacidiphilus jiangxiensis]
MAYGVGELDGAKNAAEDLGNTLSVWADEFGDDAELTPARRRVLAEQLAEVVESVQALLG